MDLLSNYPEYFQEFEQFSELSYVEEEELKKIQRRMSRIVNEATISKASPRRVAEWEASLGIKSQGTLEQRKQLIKGILSGAGKLNEESVKQITRIFTGNDSIVLLEKSTLIIKVVSPKLGETFLYEDLINALRPRVPAHISLKVIKYYATWRDVKDKYNSWGDLKNKTWGEVLIGRPVEI